MTTANKITIARILMIPLFVMMAIYYGRSVQHGAPYDWQRWAAIAIFVAAAASDGIDGYIARRFNQRSRLGVGSIQLVDVRIVPFIGKIVDGDGHGLALCPCDRDESEYRKQSR